jgi:transcriptional regulator with XRE-family HTH domain
MSEESGPETIQRVLSDYDLGAKLRQLRLRKKIGLANLAKHTGLSASMLSQLENGKMIPTLPTLARISMVFDVGLDYFFGQKRGRKLFSVVRAGERIRFPERPDLPKPNYSFECLTFAAPGQNFNAYLAEFPVLSSEGKEHFHDGTEFIFMLDGSLTIRFQGEAHLLAQGDSVIMDSSEPHAYSVSGEKPAKAVVITVPPRL